MYLRPRASAPESIDAALFCAASSASFAAREVSFTSRSDAACARASRNCADLIIDIAVSVARISNSSLLKLVMSRRERRSASCASSSRIRSTDPGVALSSPLKPTQLRKLFFSLIIFLAADGCLLDKL